ncbi:hypothetical protein [Streptomyces sp. NPDC127038]|uniref:hypothetical protein n=1 Tax=Streptomyces sp. NPDC127038 TaxID=3347114 RepID=UPI00364A5A85
MPSVPLALHAPSGPSDAAGSAGRRKSTEPADAGGRAVPPEPAGGIVAVPSVLAEAPSGGLAASGADPADSPARGSDLGEPQDTLRSWSPPKPDCRERSAPQEAAGSGRLPCWDSAAARGCGSSSKKCGPVSSVTGTPVCPRAAVNSGDDAGAGTCAERTTAGGASASPADGAGRLVPGTQAAPFQYRTYPGMEGSG